MNQMKRNSNNNNFNNKELNFNYENNDNTQFEQNISTYASDLLY